MNIEIRRSKRKTLGLEVTAEANVIVRAPLGMPMEEVQKVIEDKRPWIEKSIQSVMQRKEEHNEQEKLQIEDIRTLAVQASSIIPNKVAHYAKQLGVTYGRITIRNQKSRWGSCSGRGNLNFNCLLMLAPEEVQDYVVVHELCHRIEMNHSIWFWAEVEKILPDYKERKKWLKEFGGGIMNRIL